MHYVRHSRWLRPLTLTLIVCAALAGWLAPVTRAAGTTFMVTKTSDTADGSCTPADCSLREAIIAANKNPGADTIELQSGQVYTLSFGTAGEDQSLGGDLDIHDSVT